MRQLNWPKENAHNKVLHLARKRARSHFIRPVCTALCVCDVTERDHLIMSKLYRFLLQALNSWLSVVMVITCCLVSFYFGQLKEDMNLFAASGAVMTVFGLFSMIRFTTIEKYLNKEAIIASSTGVTGPPLSTEELARIQRVNQEKARVRLKSELRSELKGILFTITGTLIWAYGAYIPGYAVFTN